MEDGLGIRKGRNSIEASAVSKAAYPYRYVPALTWSPPDTQGATNRLTEDSLPNSCLRAKLYPLASRGLLGALLSEEPAI